MIGRPPRDIAPAALFRLLLRAEQPISFRLACAPSIPLRVRAPSMPVAADLVGLVRDRPADAWLDGALLSAVVYTPRGRAFASPEEAGLLTTEEARSLSAAAWIALAACAPTYAGSDVKAWERVILRGALDPSNCAIMVHLGICGGPESARPDLWFGRPMCELTDGQMMVFGVCRERYIERLEARIAAGRKRRAR